MANFNLNTNVVFGTNLFGTETIYNIQSVNLPGLTVGIDNIPSRYDALHAKKSNNSLDYNPLTMTIICDEQMRVWTELIKSIIKYREYNGNQGDAWINITDSTGKTVLYIKYHNIIPVAVSDLEYSTTGANDELIFEFQVEYDYYTINEEVSLSEDGMTVI